MDIVVDTKAVVNSKDVEIKAEVAMVISKAGVTSTTMVEATTTNSGRGSYNNYNNNGQQQTNKRSTMYRICS